MVKDKAVEDEIRIRATELSFCFISPEVLGSRRYELPNRILGTWTHVTPYTCLQPYVAEDIIPADSAR